MQTSSVMNTIVPAQTQAPKANDASASSDSPNSFNQVLSREMADRKSVNDAPKAKEPEAKSETKPAASGKTQDAKASGDSSDATSASDTDSTTDAQGDATAATNDMLALVASLNQANPAAQAAQQATVVDAKGVTAKDVDTAVTAAKPSVDHAGALAARTAVDRTVATASDAKTAALNAANQPRGTKTDGETDAAPDFARALGKANAPADAAQAAEVKDVKPADGTTAQTKPGQEIAAKAKEAVSVAAAKPEQAAEIKDTPAMPAALQVQQQPAVNNLTHLAASQAGEALAPRVGTPAWDQALGQKVTWMIAGEQQSASLTLNPPDLGPLQVVLNVTNSQANATFVAAQPEVRQALEAAMPRLRDMLSDAGIQLGQATVSSGSSGQQGAFDQQQSSSNARRVDVSTVRFDTPVQSGRVQPNASGQGLVDTFV